VADLPRRAFDRLIAEAASAASQVEVIGAREGATIEL